jgi:Protein of unknown function (DUF1634)
MNALSDDRRQLLRMEKSLAGLLRYGALVASGWMAIGMALSASQKIFPSVRSLITISDRFLAIGIVILIALPVLRVAFTTVVFLLEKDYRFAAISGLVLIIITVGFILGTISSHVAPSEVVSGKGSLIQKKAGGDRSPVARPQS